MHITSRTCGTLSLCELRRHGLFLRRASRGDALNRSLLERGAGAEAPAVGSGERGLLAKKQGVKYENGLTERSRMKQQQWLHMR
jgi:hypothetical protein